jgi:hypothetical protein
MIAYLISGKVTLDTHQCACLMWWMNLKKHHWAVLKKHYDISATNDYQLYRSVWNWSDMSASCIVQWEDLFWHIRILLQDTVFSIFNWLGETKTLVFCNKTKMKFKNWAKWRLIYEFEWNSPSSCVRLSLCIKIYSIQFFFCEAESVIKITSLLPALWKYRVAPQMKLSDLQNGQL